MGAAPATPFGPAEAEARLRLRLAPRDGDFAEVRVPPLPEVPGMTTEAEGRYLYGLTAATALGGAVVEVGSWLGRSTVHLAAGLRDAGLSGRLFVYDRFDWNLAHRRLAPEIPLEVGESFEPWLRRFVEPVDPHVHVRRADLGAIRWEDGPVDVLFLDAPKRWPDVWTALRIFAPHLAPGASLVVFQDYLFHLSPEIALAMDRLRRDVVRVHSVTPGGTVSFRLERPLDPRALEPPPLETLRASEVEAAWDRILADLPPAPRAQLEPGLGPLLYRIGDVEAAVRVVKAQAAHGVGLEAWREQLASLPNYRALRPLFHALDLRRDDWDHLLDREEALQARLARREADAERLRARVRELEVGSLLGVARRAARRARSALRRMRPTHRG